MSELQAALEAHLSEDPDDLATHRAYADFLLEQDDQFLAARGEFVSVQLALEDGGLPEAERERLRQREAELLQAHQRRWLGPFAPFLLDEKNISDWRRQHNKISRAGWRRGWLDELYLWRLQLDSARALVRCPAAALLRRLHVELAGYDPDSPREPDDGVPEGSEYPCLYPLAKAPFLGKLRFFQLGETVNFKRESYNCRTNAQGLVGLVRQMARVEELHLLAHDIDTAGLFALPNLEKLRVLLVYHSDEYPVEVLAGNPVLGRLATLRLHPRHSYPGERSYLPREQVVHLLRSPHLKALTHLHLHGSDLGDEGVREIIASGILERLIVLDLRHGCVRDAGARLLASCPDVRDLELLDLTYNELSEEGVRILKGAGENVECEPQYEEEDEYLYSGDME